MLKIIVKMCITLHMHFNIHSVCQVNQVKKKGPISPQYVPLYVYN